MERDPVWFDDIRVLPHRSMEFFPRASMNTAERTNALVRLLFYVTCAVYLYNRDARFVIFGAVAIGLVSFLHKDDSLSGYETYDALSGLALKDKKGCKKSSPTNPFGNFLVGDDPNDPPACSYDAQRDEIRANFNRNLFRSSEDLWERQNSQRQFYTMPNTRSIPDTKAFAEFLSGGSSRPTCKSDPSACTGVRI